MSRGQVPVTSWDRDVSHALGGIDPQLVADVGDVWGRVPAYADVMDACRYWGTTPTGVLEQLIEDSYPPPPEGWGLTQTTTHNRATGVAHNRKGKSCSR